MTPNIEAMDRLQDLANRQLEIIEEIHTLDIEKLKLVIKDNGYMLMYEALMELHRYLPDLDYRFLNYYLDDFEVDFVTLKVEVLKVALKNRWLTILGKEKIKPVRHKISIPSGDGPTTSFVLDGKERIALLRQFIKATKSRLVTLDDKHVLLINGFCVMSKNIDSEELEDFEMNKGEHLNETYVDYLLSFRLGYENIQVPFLNLYMQRLDALLDGNLYHLFCYEPIRLHQILEGLMPFCDRCNLEDALAYIRKFNENFYLSITLGLDDRNRLVNEINNFCHDAINELNAILDRAEQKKRELGYSRVLINN